MESTIADWILYQKPKARKEFIEDLCVKGFPHLVKYLDLFENLKSKKFSLEPRIYSEFILPKRIVMSMIKSNILRKEVDFVNNENGIEIFSATGMLKILLEDTKHYLANIEYLECEYRMYVNDMYDLRIDV